MITTQTTIIPVKQQSAGAVKSLTAQVQSQSRGQESEKSLGLLAKQTANLQSQINTIVGILKKTPMPPGVGSFVNNPGGFVIPYSASWTPVLSQGKYQQMTLTGPITITAPSSGIQPWQELTLILVQDATGGRAVTFTGFLGSPLTVDPNPGRASIFEFSFRSSDNKPFLVERPVTYLWP